MHIRPAPTCNTCLSERGHLPFPSPPGQVQPHHHGVMHGRGRAQAWGSALEKGVKEPRSPPPQLSRGPPARGIRKVPEVPAKHADAVRWVLWMLHCQLPGDLGVMRGVTEDLRGSFTERVAYAKPPFTQSGWLKACR